MITYLSNIIIYNLIQSGSIQEDEKDLYAYGLQQGLFIILNIVTSIVIGIFTNMLWQCVLFMITYLPLRSFAGGYHARTHLHCYLYSIILNVSVILAINLISWHNLFSFAVALMSGIIIFILSPVEDINKPLDQTEFITYKKCTRVILSFILLIFLFYYMLNLNNILPVFSVSLFTLCFMLILGKIKNNATRIQTKND